MTPPEIDHTFQCFNEKQQELLRIVRETSDLLSDLDMAYYSQSLRTLQEKLTSDTFKIVVLGDFNRGKSTFINALLGRNILPTSARPTTAIINKVKYGDEPSAALYFMNPLPKNISAAIPENVKNHLEQSHFEQVPPLQIAYDDLEEYVVIPSETEVMEGFTENPFKNAELCWPLPLLNNGVEIIDTPGLNENPIRSNITRTYLQKADAVIFVFSALQVGTLEEREFLQDVLSPLGFSEGNIFYIVNRYDQLQNDKDREEVKSYAESCLDFGTKDIFYISAYQALNGKINNDQALVENSGIFNVEKALSHYLIYKKGNAKLEGPAGMLMDIIQNDVLKTAIPQKRTCLATDLNVLEKRYADALPQLESLEEKRKSLDIRIETLITHMESEIRRYVDDYFENLPKTISQWVAEYPTKTKVSLPSIKADIRTLTDEVTTHIDRKLFAENQMWINNSLKMFTSEKIKIIKDAINSDVVEYCVIFDSINLDITGIRPNHTSDPDFLNDDLFILYSINDITDVKSILNMSFKLSQGVIQEIGARIAYNLASILNKNSVAIQGLENLIKFANLNPNALTDMHKDQIVQACCEKLRESTPEIKEMIVRDVLTILWTFGTLTTKSLDLKVKEFRSRTIDIINEIKLGEENIARQNEVLNIMEKKLRNMSSELSKFMT